jgi:multiple sugar transport system permease protein
MENYRNLWNDPFFWTSLKNNVAWLILYFLAIPGGLMIALFLNQTVAGIRLYKSLFFFPFVLSQVVVGLVFSWFYLPDGLLNAVLAWFGGPRTNILGNNSTATYGIIAAGLWPQTAYCMILYLTGLNAVDPEQIEAARLDGAKGPKMLWYVVLPQLWPATFIAIVVTVIGALRSFDLITIMTNGGPGFYNTSVLAFYMYDVALSEFGFRMGYGSAIAVILFLIMMVYIAGFLWKMWRDERVG